MMPLCESISSEWLEDVPCGVCGQRNRRLRFTLRGFSFWDCACGILYVSPRLRQEKLDMMYSSESYYNSENSLLCGYVDYKADRDNILATCAKRFNWMLAKSGKTDFGRILDIGCAMGFAVEYALGRGWDAYGIEPSFHAAQVAREKLPNRVYHGSINDHPFEKGSFSMILLWDVIEHLPDPGKILNQVRELLAPGGILSIITPDAGSLLARLMGRHWMEFAKPTEHILFFTSDNLSGLLERTGFDIIEKTTTGKFVDGSFLLERLCAYFSFLEPLKRSSIIRKCMAGRIYIDPRDKMMVMARKI
jgi:2-polyprenyl-3-methyl-5-hydroxy-6-metoxy-1,4-benzoquinol methylase